MDLYSYWEAVLSQNEDAIVSFFHQDALIRWHNTNEQFTVEEFLRANCDYPGSWDGTVERIEQLGDLRITVTHVFSKDGALSFHVTSFLKIEGGKICLLDEYWGDDGPAPQWRQDLNIGRPIR